MSPYYRRRKPGLKENLEAGVLAAGLAAGVAAVTFYLGRLFLARDPLWPLGAESSGESPRPGDHSGDSTNDDARPEAGDRG
jgi:hypothetical protein